MPRKKNLPFGFEEGDQHVTIVLKHRLRDKCEASLSRQARAVNFVWNYCNEAQRHAFQTRWAWKDKWLSYGQLAALTGGSSKELGLQGHTIQKVCDQYVLSRKQQKKRWLRFREWESLGWVPFSNDQVTFDGEAFTFNGVRYEPMHVREGVFYPAFGMSGSFNQDSKGHWYINITVDMRVAAQAPNTRVGIDLGLETLAGLSDGREIEPPRFYRKNELALATAQRARKAPKKIRAIHAKAANRRRDFLHKESAKIAKEYGLIVVGDVSPSKLAKTRMAKSVLDAGWADFRTMLSYKALMRGGMCLEVNEAWSSQICSCCGCLPKGRPKGIADLGMREWSCGDCGAVHRRDVNAARNILRIGLDTLAEGARP
jgi:putative transposase